MANEFNIKNGFISNNNSIVQGNLTGTVITANAGITTGTTDAFYATGSINSYLEYNIQNTSSGTSAQSGYGAMADNGTLTSGFVWMGINNSTFNFPATYNIGVSGDTSFLGSGNDMYIANSNPSKAIIFSTGIVPSPYFSEIMRMSGSSVSIGTPIMGTPTYGIPAILTVASPTGGTIDLKNSSTSITAGTSVGKIQFTVKSDTTIGYSNAFIETIAFGTSATGAGGGSIMRFATAINQGGSSPTERMRIDQAGNVSINSTGNTALGAVFLVNGNSLIQGNLTATTISATTYQGLPSNVISVISGSSLFSTGLSNTGLNASGVTNSIFFGVGAGQVATGATASNFLGNNAGYGATGASNSNFFGQNAGYLATGGSNSNFFGFLAGYGANQSYQSNFFGPNAGMSATSASNSNFMGSLAGSGATSASYSNFLGISAGQGATSAQYSNFIGQNAGSGATGANNSNFLGNNAGKDAINASYSNFIGYQTGKVFAGNNLGSNNIVIGTNISLPNATTNSINIGGVLFGSGTYSSTLGNPSITAQTQGRIGINVVSPIQALQVSGNTLVQGNLYVTGGTQSLFSGSSSIEMVRIVQDGSGDAFVVEDVSNGDPSHFVINASGNTAIGLTQPLGNDKLTVSGDTSIYGVFKATTVSAATYSNLPATTFNGGTVSGATTFTGGLNANTISATTITSAGNIIGGGAASFTGIVTSNASSRAPIFYDTDNTGYYLDPAATSNLNGLIVNSAPTFATSTVSTYIPAGYAAGNMNNYTSKQIGSAADYNQFVILLHPVYNGTLITYYECDGKFIKRRGSTSSGLSLGSYEVQTKTAYNTNAYSLISSIGGNGDLYTCTYGGVKYVCLVPDYTVSGCDIGFDGYIKGDGNALLIVPYYNSNTSSVLNTEINSSLAIIATTSQSNINFKPSITTLGNLTVSNSSTVGAITIDGAQSSHRQYTIQNAITGISNAGFQIRDVTGNVSLMYFDASYNATFGYIVTAAASHRAPIFYDTDNTGYYLDPASTSNINALQAAGTITAANFNSPIAQFSTNGSSNDPYGAVSVTNTSVSNWSYYGMTRAGQLGAGIGITTGSKMWLGTATGGGASSVMGTSWLTMDGAGATFVASITASILYDSNNTGYYVDPASTSNLNILTLANIYYSNYNTATGIANNSFNTAKTVLGNIHINNGGGASGNNYQAAITFQGSSANEAQAGIYVSNNSSTGTAMGFATTDSYTTGPQLFFYALNDGTTYFPKSYAQASNSFRAPIFYDSNNTGYYLDPASTSNLNGLTVAGTISGSITGNAEYIASNPNRTDVASYPVVWSNGNTYSPNYSCAAVNIQSSTGTLQATTLRATADVVAYYSSDIRFKDNITPIKNALAKIQQIGGYEFDWNDNQETHKGHDLGIIAQEVEELFPEIVANREDGYKSVKYERLIPVLIEAIKEQSSIIDKLIDRIEKLENK